MDGGIETLLAADPAALSHDARLSRLADLAVLESQVAAARVRTLAMIEVDPPLRSERDVMYRDRQYVREEVAALLHIAPQTARQRMADAVDLCHELEATVTELESGSISIMHARTLLDLTRDVGTEIRAKVEERVLARGARQTVSEFRQAVKRAVLSLDRRGEKDKRTEEVKKTGVWSREEKHGMASLYMYSTAEDVASVMTSVQARSSRELIEKRRTAGAGNDLDERTPDQRRVDALVGMCLGDLASNDTTQHGRKPSIQVTIAWSTVFGRDNQPADLAGYGPISAEQARKLAAEAEASWRWLMHDETGQIIDISTDTYRPPAGLRDFILARDRTCRHPGCRKQARHCELDHRQRFTHGGKTCRTNLDGQCLRHHHLKEEAGWTVLRRPDGTTIWISPTGRSYAKPPDWIPLDTTSQPPPEPPPDEDDPPF